MAQKILFLVKTGIVYEFLKHTKKASDTLKHQPRGLQYLTHANSHITLAVAAMDSCFVLVRTHQHGIAPGQVSLTITDPAVYCQGECTSTPYQCGPGSIPGLGVICGLSLLLVLVLAPRGFSPGTPVFPSPQKPTFLNSNSIWKVSPISAVRAKYI